MNLRRNIHFISSFVKTKAFFKFISLLREKRSR